MKAQVIMSSEEFGRESFDYDTIKDAKAGFKRLKKSIKKLNDGVERRLELVQASHSYSRALASETILCEESH